MHKIDAQICETIGIFVGDFSSKKPNKNHIRSYQYSMRPEGIAHSARRLRLTDVRVDVICHLQNDILSFGIFRGKRLIEDSRCFSDFRKASRQWRQKNRVAPKWNSRCNCNDWAIFFDRPTSYKVNALYYKFLYNQINWYSIQIFYNWSNCNCWIL